MRLLEMFKYSVFNKGKLEGIQFVNGQLELKEKAPSTKIIQLVPQDIDNFYFKLFMPYLGHKYIQINSNKGSYQYFSDSINKETYFNVLRFLGEEQLIVIKNSKFRKMCIMVCVFLIIGLISHFMIASFNNFLFYLGVIFLFFAVDDYRGALKQLEDYKKLGK